MADDHRAIRTAIETTLNTVTGIGAVELYERYLKRQADLAALYKVAARLKGWHIRRVGLREKQLYLGRNEAVHRWEIRGFMSLDDADETELLFDDLLDLIRVAFRADDSLGGEVDSCTVGDEAGIQIRESGPVMFAGVLCHSVRLGLNTRVYCGTC